jgi:flagellar assembly factor FliW
MGTTQPDQPNRLKFVSTRFGEIELAPSEILTFPEGLLGFSAMRRFVLINDPEEEPFLWLQALDDQDLAFVVVDPFLFFPGYQIQVKPHELATILLNDISKATVLAIITIPEEPMNLTANLRGPIVINSENNLVKQLVLIDDRYNTKHFLLKEIPDYLAVAPGQPQSQVPMHEPQDEQNDSPSTPKKMKRPSEKKSKR